MASSSFFEKYSIDTNVIVSFLGDGPDELYPIDVFGPQWNFLESAFVDGRVIAAKQVEVELKKWERLEHMKTWLQGHSYVFREITSSDQLAAAKEIVNVYEVYGHNRNRLGDLEVMSLAKARGLTVITMESAKEHRIDRPKIPNVCEEFGIGCLNFLEFLRTEGFPGSNSSI